VDGNPTGPGAPQYPDGKEVADGVFIAIGFLLLLDPVDTSATRHGLGMWIVIPAGQHRILFSPAEPEH
jgi:hypothetical protein